jgi:hypothetical protein
LDFLNKHIIKIVALIIVFIILNKCNSSNTSSTDNDPLSISKVSVDTNDKDLYVFERPDNGFSPYNNYYGKGVYHNNTDNTIKVTAPTNKDIVILIEDIYSKRKIRNEYIRANTVFLLTGIPYGTYKFYYLHGENWSSNANFKGGLAKGNFLKEKGVGKSDKIFDVEFEVGYTGTYSLTLQLVSNGNLNTITGSESEL